jgi:molybdenum cofactor cytidylyltransferase
MGGPNKLLARFGTEPLVRLIATRALASKAASTIVVTGHQAERLEEALAGLDVRFVHNPAYAEGLSTSLKAGIAALPSDAAGALVVLGDMPNVGSADLDRLIDAFRERRGQAIVRAAHSGRRGNPVVLPHALFGDVARLEGDMGAKGLIEASTHPVADVEIGEGAFLDVDTPDLMKRAGGVLQD